MDVFANLQRGDDERSPLVTVGMHTTGEPTRIVLSGFGERLEGATLLDKRDFAKRHLDHLRRRLMWEPRGHTDMYGAILVAETELTQSGAADMGVLFCHNEGYSTMCGHATLALGRFLIDTADERVFPRRGSLKHDPETQTTDVNLHAPCGLVRITVPTRLCPTSGAITYDGGPERAVSFLSVPSFATAVGVEVCLPVADRWESCPEGGRVIVDVAYGGAFYVIIDVRQLGFSSLQATTLPAIDRATAALKAHITRTPALNALCTHPTEKDLSFLYGVVVVDAHAKPYTETGVCYFADQALDRSPTGSAVGARVALAVAKGDLALNQPWAYHSVVSLGALDAQGAFVGTAVEHVAVDGGCALGGRGVVVRTQGRAFYTDASVFVAEADDVVGRDGFVVSLPKGETGS